MYAKRRVVVRRVVAMFNWRSVHIEGLSYKSSDRAKSAARQRVVWRASLETERQNDNAITRRLALCRVVASDNATHQTYQITHHN
jgi:hypothetical protein